ncbi:hypothetical protein [Orbus mooreae]|uniref:hypothetical protein n=1 Tax=Orbus mooreae TaxID=3074107 RepID=UPI00370DB431
MNIFKLISSVTGVIITVGTAYAAQQKISQLLHDEIGNGEKTGSSHLGTKAITLFAVTTLVGGAISHIINKTY